MNADVDAAHVCARADFYRRGGLLVGCIWIESLDVVQKRPIAIAVMAIHRRTRTDDSHEIAAGFEVRKPVFAGFVRVDTHHQPVPLLPAILIDLPEDRYGGSAHRVAIFVENAARDHTVRRQHDPGILNTVVGSESDRAAREAFKESGLTR